MLGGVGLVSGMTGKLGCAWHFWPGQLGRAWCMASVHGGARCVLHGWCASWGLGKCMCILPGWKKFMYVLPGFGEAGIWVGIGSGLSGVSLLALTRSGALRASTRSGKIFISTALFV